MTTSRLVRLHLGAEADARAARRYYAERNPETADRFMAEIDRAIAAIGDHPNRWPPHVRGTRKLLRRFPYSVIYRAGDQGVLVVPSPTIAANPIFGSAGSRNRDLTIHPPAAVVE